MKYWIVVLYAAAALVNLVGGVADRNLDKFLLGVMFVVAVFYELACQRFKKALECWGRR